MNSGINPGRRGMAGGLIALAHLGLIAVLARISLAPASVEPDATPVSVVFMQPQARVHQAARLPQPALQKPQPVSTVMPDLDLALEPAPAAITVAAEPAAPAPTAPSPAADAPPRPASMSQVAYLRAPRPRYPGESRSAREEGLVLLQVLIDTSGHARQIRVLRSSGHPRLDRAACSAIEQALFRPYSVGGVAREAIATVPVEFSLHRVS